MKKLSFHKLIATAALSGFVTTAYAHLNIAPEDAVAAGDKAREYKEGTGAFIDINISHDCSNADGEHFATTGVAVLLPNGSAVENTYTTSRDGAVYGANAVMGIKQRSNSTFEKNIVVKGAVDPFYNHGVRTEDARALKWLKGRVDNDHYDNLEMKVTFPKIEPSSCVAKLRMYFPSMQYCTNGYKYGWLGTADSKFGMGDEKTKIYDRYAAYLDVVRTSEMPEACGEGFTQIVRPTTEEINQYLDNRVEEQGKGKRR